ncbi:MAG: P-loop NTPase fold protein [Dyadobacter sp.]|uniref:KAP family P-loop NTPase fold protein n=1 Tax=Dyadobacter sp. TaxID=1914288 RepID=UPI0032651A53
MWADNETSEDLLGFKIHADLLVDVIKDDKVLPVTIGVFGDWGSGKSSILKIVEEELTAGGEDGFKDGTLVLYFNGWVFEGYDDAKAALLESIIEKFAKHKTIGNKVKDKTAKLFKSVKWMRLLGLSFKKVIIPGAAAYLTGGASLLPFLVNEFSKFQPQDVAEKLTGEDAEDFLKDIIKKNEDEDVTIVREFRNDFKEMIDESEIKKLVVIIDDLDRCTPDRLIENLEAIKLFLNVEKTAFVIGADPRIVRHAIEHRYKTDSIENADDPNSRNKRIVSDYLEKLIQIPYYLPKLTDNEVETYLTLLFCKMVMGDDFLKVINAFKKNRENSRYDVFGLGDIQDLATEEQRKQLTESVSLIASLSPIITEGLKGNPRQIKRFLNTFTLRNRLVKVAKLSDFKIEILAKLMVLEYSSTNLFKEIYNWQSLQKGESQQLVDLEKLAVEEKTDEIKKQFSSDWASEKVMKWLNAEPKLANVDLRDYYWISRDQLSTTISGASLIPPHIRSLTKKLIDHGSGSILTNIITQEVIGKLNTSEFETLLSLLEKELSKFSENDSIHKVFIEMMAKNIQGVIESYGRAIAKTDNSKIPFSLRSEFALAEVKNVDVKSLYSQFEKTSQIYKALNPKK